MVQPTETGNRHDLPHFSRLDRPRIWNVLLESEVRSVFVVVVDIRLNHSAKLTLIDSNQMVQAISS